MRVLRFESWAMKGRVSARAVKMKSTGGTVRQTDRQTALRSTLLAREPVRALAQSGWQAGRQAMVICLPGGPAVLPRGRGRGWIEVGRNETS